MGKFIAIDGLDGSGKGTQSEKLVEYLKGTGKKVRVLSSPEKWYGVTYREDKEMVKVAMAQFVAEGKYKGI